MSYQEEPRAEGVAALPACCGPRLPHRPWSGCVAARLVSLQETFSHHLEWVMVHVTSPFHQKARNFEKESFKTLKMLFSLKKKKRLLYLALKLFHLEVV